MPGSARAGCRPPARRWSTPDPLALPHFTLARRPSTGSHARRRRRLPLGQRNVLGVGGAGVLGARPDQAVVAVLLEDVRRPARDTTQGKDRRELIRWDA